MTATSTRPRIPAAALTAASTRLFGAVVLDLGDLTITPAIYLPRAAAFATIDGDQLGDDDGSLIVLVHPGEAADLVTEYGTPAAAAAAMTRQLRAAGVL